MRPFLSFLVIGLLAASPALAEGTAKPAKGLALAGLSCADLKPSVRRAHAECLPAPRKEKLGKERVKAVLVSDDRGASRKRLTKMPWMTGVFQ